MRKNSRETQDVTACERKETHWSIVSELLCGAHAMVIKNYKIKNKKDDIASLRDAYQNTEREKSAYKARTLCTHKDIDISQASKRYITEMFEINSEIEEY